MEDLLNLPFSSSSSDDSEEEFLAPKRKKVFRLHCNFNIFIGMEFRERFRLREEEVEFVLSMIGNSLQHRSNKNGALSPKEQLLLALHWLGNGSQYHAICDMHGVSKATVCRALKKVISCIFEHMFPAIVKFPENSIDVPVEFLRKGGFPNVSGCVDGILIDIDAPVDNEAAYVDRHGNHSINAMMVAGPDLSFFYVSARWPGSVHDARVIRNSNLATKFDGGWRPFDGAVLLGTKTLIKKYTLI